MKTFFPFLLGILWITAASAQQSGGTPNVNPNLLYGKALHSYNMGGPVTTSDMKDFYRGGGQQAIIPQQNANETFMNRQRRESADANRALMQLHQRLNRLTPQSRVKLPDMPSFQASPLQGTLPQVSRSSSDMTQSSDPLDMLTTSDQTLSPAFRYPGLPSGGRPEVKGYNFFSGSSTSGSSASGSRFLGGSSRQGSSVRWGSSALRSGAGGSSSLRSSLTSPSSAQAPGSSASPLNSRAPLGRGLDK